MTNRQYGDTIFTITPDFMDTIIQNSLVDLRKQVRVNNLFICSIYERGYEFCEFCKTQPDNMFPLISDIFRVKMNCYPDNTFILFQGECSVKFSMDMINDYYRTVLEHIGINEVGDPYLFYKEKE